MGSRVATGAAVKDQATIDEQYRYWRVRVMYGMMGGYALYYFVRKNISIASKAITDEFQFTNTEWGIVLSVATVVYAFSKFFSGVLADRVNPKYMMSIGLLASALVNIMFGLGESLIFFIAFWALNNLFQGAGMPPCSKLLTSWFAPREIGSAWGLWNASHQIGGAVIMVWAGYLVAHNGWRAAFWIPGILCVVGAFWLFNRLTNTPESMGLPPVEVYKGEAVAAKKDEAPFREIFGKYILRNKWVWIVSIANFFVYIVRIGIMDWAPKYLQEAKGFDIKQASYALSGFEIAGIFGAFASGWISDKIFKGRRGPVSVYFMLLLIASVGILFFVPSGQLGLMSAIFCAVGFLVYGPQLLVAVAAADFATKQAASSAVGLTGLTGYMGASVCGVVTGMLVDAYGWDAAIFFYLLSAIAGCLLLAMTWFKSAHNATPDSVKR
ncbi:MFS transporter [Oligoflexus tunisiensis]|uniref:MFS transporter n=1 Tax=Oligoflexus tunisiensis TaxID=708132 RepID=UPI000AD0484B|nr:MFS transporter [Oligoflexus tunisiensis]